MLFPPLRFQTTPMRAMLLPTHCVTVKYFTARRELRKVIFLALSVTLWPIEEQISARQDKLKLSYSASESVVCRAIPKLRQSV